MRVALVDTNQCSGYQWLFPGVLMAPLTVTFAAYEEGESIEARRSYCEVQVIDERVSGSQSGWVVVPHQRD
jgi:hypothetical protein